MNILRANGIKLSVTIVACVLAVLHIVEPQWKIDSITIGLLILACLPWLASFIASLKLPGGWEITFRDVQAASAKLEQLPIDSLHASADAEQPTASLSLQTTDPNLALVGLRIDIERRLNAVAVANDIPPQGSARSLLEALTRAGLIHPDTADGLRQIIRYGDEAAHGAKVDPAVADWARDWGPEIVRDLSRMAN